MQVPKKTFKLISSFFNISYNRKHLFYNKTRTSNNINSSQRFYHSNEIVKLGVPLVHGDASLLQPHVMSWIQECINLCQPDNVHLVDGSVEEDKQIKDLLVQRGQLIPLPKYQNCFLGRTDPRDVARTEAKTFLVSEHKYESIPTPAKGVKGTLGNWMSPEDLDREVATRFPGCMKGRTMYVIPFSMGPVGSPLSKIGLEITDSAYVAVHMRIMTRVGSKVLTALGEDEFVKCLHSTGGTGDVAWPCDPEKVIVAHKLDSMEIISFGSGYGGNSLLGKKYLALRLGSALGRKEVWLAEHMLIAGVKGPQGDKTYIAAAFPSACGKTNMAMMKPKIAGFNVDVVGDDIAWLKPDSQGRLRAINPENGFFGVAPGTSTDTNPIAMDTIFKDTIFSNVALTPDGGVWWEGMEAKPDSAIDWLGQPWTPASLTPAAHPNSRFCTPITSCPAADPAWDDPAGVPISTIIFGGRRPQGVPLVYQAISWQHGVFMGSSLSSESTAAAEQKSGNIMHDPFSMRPFFGYNFGAYLQHWLDLGPSLPADSRPAIFMVNWFRRSVKDGSFLWPGFGENIRVIDWIIKRSEGRVDADLSPVGMVPKRGDLDISGLKEMPDMEQLMSTPAEFWLREVEEMKDYYEQQVGESLPTKMWDELNDLKRRLQ